MTNALQSLAMPDKPISVRLDADAQRALAELTAGGASQSEAIRKALIDASHAAWYAQAREDAKRIAADPADRAEIAAIQEFFGELDLPG
jgi:Arc/MetJ-type ribon-helix-helix transcriptional regulator